MRLSWPEHLHAAHILELSSQDQWGTSMALMGVALLMLAQDLLQEQLEQTAPPSSRNQSDSEL